MVGSRMLEVYHTSQSNQSNAPAPCRGVNPLIQVWPRQRDRPAEDRLSDRKNTVLIAWEE